MVDFDLTLDDMLLSAYRLSWPAPERKGPARRLAQRLRQALARDRLEGWPVALSAPMAQEPA